MDDVHLILACDRNFRMQLGVALSSICRTFDFQRRRLVVHLFTTGLGPADRARVEAEAAGFPARLLWHEFDPSPLSGSRTHGHVSMATYYRILAFDRLAREVPRAIYLDCDLVVVSDLNGLWDFPLRPGHLFAAAQEAAVPWFDAARALERQPEALARVRFKSVLPIRDRLGIPPSQPYFNAGVLLVDLSAWAAGGATERTLQFMREESIHLAFWDQDALNGLFWSSWSRLPSRWNTMPWLTRYEKTASALPWEDVSDAISQPAIIHYASELKPWHIEYPGPFRKDWLDALAHSTWSAWTPGRLDFWKRKAAAPIRYLRDGLAYHGRRLRARRARPGDRP